MIGCVCLIVWSRLPACPSFGIFRLHSEQLLRERVLSKSRFKISLGSALGLAGKLRCVMAF